MTNIVLMVGLLAAGGVRAGVLTFLVPNDPGGQCVFSRDGWHLACLSMDDRRITKDGVELVKEDRPEVLNPGPFRIKPALSDDGKVLIHQVGVFDENGLKSGVRLAINGKAVGEVYREFRWLAFGPTSSDIAFAVESAQGHRVITASSSGPAFERGGSLFAVGAGGRVAYSHEGLMIDHAAEPGIDDADFTPDFKSRSTVSKPDSNGVMVRRNGAARPDGPWGTAYFIQISPDGAHTVYLASRQARPEGSEFIVLDGVPHPCNAHHIARGGGARSKAAVFSRSGAAAWVCKSKNAYTLFRNGKAVASFSSRPTSFAFTSADRPYVLTTDSETALVPGGPEELPRPLHDAVLGGDGEDLHYYGRSRGRTVLVCVTPGQDKPQNCARKARSLYGAPLEAR